MFLPPGFDQPLAVQAAGLVLQAYAQYAAFKSGQVWELAGGYQNLGLLDARPDELSLGREPFGFVALNLSTKNVFVTFRGTESVFDWLADLSIAQVQHPWGKVAQGFDFIYTQCAGSVQAAVGRRSPGAPVFVTGHSLGAAVAALASADLAINGIVPQMYSFASPRLGDPAFATQFNSRVPVHWRIANTEDIVTTVPLATARVDDADSVKLSPIGLVLRDISGLEYQHVGDAVPFTIQRGTIVGNHDMGMYHDTLSAARAAAAIALYFTIAANDAGSRLAPPTSAPSISSSAIKLFTLSGLTLPP